jgi:hypothetical protein
MMHSFLPLIHIDYQQKVTSKANDGDYQYVIYTEKTHPAEFFKIVMGSTGDTRRYILKIKLSRNWSDCGVQAQG